MLRVLAGILTLALAMTAAAADELADQMKAADGLAGAGKFLEAMDAIDDAATLVWDRSPLCFRRALWVTEAPAGFGAYTPRPTNENASGAE